MQTTHKAQFAGLYAADQNGDYSAEGLKVTLIEGGPEVDFKAAVTSGKAQFGITSPRDFAGKTIRTSQEITPTLHAMTARVGIPPDQYSEVILPSDVQMFVTGDVPVWSAYLNGMVIAVQQAGYKINLIYPDDYGIHFYSDGIIATYDFISAKPDLTLRFLRATLKGWEYVANNPSKAGELVARYNPKADLNFEYLRMISTLPLVNTGEDHIGWMKPEVWSAMENTLLEQAVLTQPLDVTQVYTMQFLEEIYK